MAAAMLQVIQAGRASHGAFPSTSFQLFVTGYTQFWNDDNPACDTVYWNPYGATTQYLTRAKRLRMNQMVVSLPRVVRES